MIGERKINSAQLYSIFFVGRLLLSLMLMPTDGESFVPTDMFVQLLFWDVALFLCVLPVFFLLKGRRDTNLFDSAQAINPLLCKVIATAYAALFIYHAITTVARFEIFSTSVIFPEMNSILFIFLFLVVCTGIAVMGIEALGRASTIITVCVLIGLAFIFSTLCRDVKPLNFTPLFYNGAYPVLEAAATSLSRTVEIAALAVIVPRVTGNLKKGYVKWLAGLSAVILVIIFFIVGVLGDFSGTLLFPVYTLSAMAHLGVLQRLDAFLTSIWILCALVKTSFLLILVGMCMERVLKKRLRKIYIAGGGLIVLVVSVFISIKAERFIEVSDNLFSMVLFGVVVVGVPLLLLLLEKVRGRKKA